MWTMAHYQHFKNFLSKKRFVTFINTGCHMTSSFGPPLPLFIFSFSYAARWPWTPPGSWQEVERGWRGCWKQTRADVCSKKTGRTTQKTPPAPVFIVQFEPQSSAQRLPWSYLRLLRKQVSSHDSWGLAACKITWTKHYCLYAIVSHKFKFPRLVFFTSLH